MTPSSLKKQVTNLFKEGLPIILGSKIINLCFPSGTLTPYSNFLLLEIFLLFGDTSHYVLMAPLEMPLHLLVDAFTSHFPLLPPPYNHTTVVTGHSPEVSYVRIYGNM